MGENIAACHATDLGSNPKHPVTEYKDNLVLRQNLCRTDRGIWSIALLAGINEKEILEEYMREREKMSKPNG